VIGEHGARLAYPSRVRTVLLERARVVAAAVFAAAGVRRPGYVVTGGQATPLAHFWATSSAVRTWALAGTLIPALARSDSRDRSVLLVTAGLVQLGDAALGVGQHDPAMTTAPRSWA